MNPHDIYRIIFKDSPDIMDVKQVSELLEVRTKTVYRLLKDGTISSIKVGREFRIPKYEVMKYLNIIKADDVPQVIQ